MGWVDDYATYGVPLPYRRESEMTEITQADRDAVKAYYVETGFVADQKGLEQAFARHRMEERAAIVALLRPILEQWLETAREHLDTEVAGRTFEALERMK